MNAKDILNELKSMGNEQTRKVLANHGAPDNQYGVKVEDMKKIQKRIRKDYELALDLFNSGVPDAQYLAGLIADETRFTRSDVQHWADHASWQMVNEYTVPWIAAESGHGYSLALEWIDSKKENLQAAGWATLSNWLALKPDSDLDLKKIQGLLKRVEKEIGQAANRVCYTMNGFVIAVGCYVKDLSEEAKNTGKRLGKLTVNTGGTASKLPYSPDYIQKAVDKGHLGKKKKMVRC